MTLTTVTTLIKTDHEWRELGLCFGTRDPAFFPARGDSTKRVKSICARCPSLDPCLEFAVVNRERFGVWGCTTEKQRQKERRARVNGSQVKKAS